ncbi:MAG: alpha/beta hydrolase, partial [Cyanobacteria bacterium P01_G01_bin.19]
MFFQIKKAKYSFTVAIAFLIVLIASNSAILSAEKIRFNYSLLGFKVLVEDLAAFARQNEISSSLNFYLKRISAEQQTEFRKFLNQSYDVDPVLVYRYSRTSVGIRLLERIGEIIQLPGNLNGFYGLRASVVQTAELKGETNLINFIEQFPTDIRLNLDGILKLVQQISNNRQDTKEFIADIADKETRSKAGLKNIPDLSQLGTYRTSKQTLELLDKKRDRLLNTDLYLPEAEIDNIPVVVVSNGLGAKRDRFEELAHHLASYGFAV